MWGDVWGSLGARVSPRIGFMLDQIELQYVRSVQACKKRSALESFREYIMICDGHEASEPGAGSAAESAAVDVVVPDVAAVVDGDGGVEDVGHVHRRCWRVEGSWVWERSCRS